MGGPRRSRSDYFVDYRPVDNRRRDLRVCRKFCPVPPDTNWGGGWGGGVCSRRSIVDCRSVRSCRTSESCCALHAWHPAKRRHRLPRSRLDQSAFRLEGNIRATWATWLGARRDNVVYVAGAASQSDPVPSIKERVSGDQRHRERRLSSSLAQYDVSASTILLCGFGLL